MNTSSQFRIMMNDVCGKSDAINLSFGDGVYHPFMEILGMIYFWGFIHGDIGDDLFLGFPQFTTYSDFPIIQIFQRGRSFGDCGTLDTVRQRVTRRADDAT